MSCLVSSIRPSPPNRFVVCTAAPTSRRSNSINMGRTSPDGATNSAEAPLLPLYFGRFTVPHRACTGLARRIRLGRVHAVEWARRRTTQRRCPRLPRRWSATCGRHPWHERRISKAGDLRGGRIGPRRTRSATRVPDLEHRHHRTNEIVDRLCACGVAPWSASPTGIGRSPRRRQPGRAGSCAIFRRLRAPRWRRIKHGLRLPDR